ncbi:hypothetical protein [Mucilaginibacter sp. NFX135]|uniref:hypothetical protein n=1 Tax=Mucilaginibacter sp. NFX135 TaxID=3402687 RepID=UPI003AFB07F2
MKRIYIGLLLIFLCSNAIAQTYGSLSSNNNGVGNWVNIGTANLPQGGFDAYIRIIGGAGYNANIGQMGHVELHIMSSNSVNVDGNGFGFAATATSYGRSNFISQIHIVPNNSGVNANAFTIYAYCGPYSGNTFYSAEVSPGCSWTSSNTLASGTPGGYNVPFECQINGNSFLIGSVGVNTNYVPVGYQFAVNGSMIATSATVQLRNSWPDYVFKKGYQLPSLQEVKAYIDQNQHLPEIPSEQQIAKDGLNLGEMNKLLMKKVEELTLYLIEKDKEKKEQESINSVFRDQITWLIKQNETLHGLLIKNLHPKKVKE